MVSASIYLKFETKAFCFGSQSSFSYLVAPPTCSEQESGQAGNLIHKLAVPSLLLLQVQNDSTKHNQQHLHQKVTACGKNDLQLN